MDIVVVFRFPEIADLDGAEAAAAVDLVTLQIKEAGIDCESWHIDEVLGDTP